MTDEEQAGLTQRVARLERELRWVSESTAATYAEMMGREVDGLRQRWERTQQLMSVPIQRLDLHSHTPYSDGKDSVEEMDRWRHRAGLAILAITDHNTLAHVSDVAQFPHLIAGEEVTGSHHHVLILQPPYLIPPAHELSQEVANIRQAGGLPLVAHPTGWRGNIYDQERIAAVRALTGAFMMEIGNGAGNWYTYKDSTDDTAVALFDALLEAGVSVIATGDSDAHHAANVGMVWNGVISHDATPGVLLEAIGRGSGFVSNGPAALLSTGGRPPSTTRIESSATHLDLHLEMADSAGLSHWRLVASGVTWETGELHGQHEHKQDIKVSATASPYYRLEVVAQDGRCAYSNPIRLALH